MRAKRKQLILDEEDDELDLNLEEDNLEDDEKESSDGVVPVELQDAEENEISFVVIKDITDYASYTCPHCQYETQIALRSFRRTQYKDHVCFNCGKPFLLRLMFNIELKSYV